MITEDYVSFETAKLLNEKGFDEPCALTEFDCDAYKKWVETAPRPITLDAESEKPFRYPVPSIYVAMKWLREVHKVEVRVSYDIDKTTWWGGCNPMYEENEENSNMFQSLLEFDYPGKTYEESCEAAIKYCLEKMEV